MHRILLHIGARKCGSTTLQKYFAIRSHELSRLGVRYVQSGRMGAHRGDGHYAHHHAALIDKFGDSKWDEIMTELLDAPEELGILSSELFYSLPDEHIAYIRDRLSDFEVQVLLVVRDPMAFLKSEYKQQIKMGGEHRSFSDFAARTMHLVDFESAAETWRRTFGPESVVVLNADECRAEGPSALIVRALALCGIDGLVGPELTPQENVSPGDGKTLVLRALNRVGGRRRFVKKLKNSIRRGRPVGKAFAAAVKPFLGKALIDRDEIEAVRVIIAEKIGSTTPDASPIGVYR